ncbi:uncharacterized protein GGS25DRAFT_518411 [Hypoxylon fragiforme]|uniref:uncharacterized protein n=1 Tax=Hypoxylon fragiforme TaxID=63214 RepID=UPI0020C5C692|nr:uncharacterized protein GGS25DRAFT_518411 [Hypoxylon fragiforme]KAI2612726.1 hypothetical protein GGS25DRAFT_518411 [Hypoxylon fragiforme]
MARTNQLTSLLSILMAASTALAAATPNPTIPREATGTTCENPNQTTGYPDYNAFCQCPPYAADSPAFGNPHLGLVRCETKCMPADSAHRVSRPETGSLDECMKACSGSFEKRGLEERQQDWFCHGVNFMQGQLCEFIGSIGATEFVEGGSDCWYMDGLDGPGS